MNNQNNTKVVTGVVRLSYANVWEPKSINGGAEKDTNLQRIGNDSSIGT